MRRTLALAAATSLALALTACAPEQDDSVVEDELGLDANGDQGAGADPDDQQAVPGGGPLPGPGECVDLEPTAADDDAPELREWVVGDAGVVLTTTEGEGLILQGAQPAAGWEGEVIAEDAESATVEFRAEGITVVVEVTDGGEAAEVCGQ